MVVAQLLQLKINLLVVLHHLSQKSLFFLILGLILYQASDGVYDMQRMHL